MKKLLVGLLITVVAHALLLEARHSYKYIEMLPKNSMVKEQCRWCEKGLIFGYEVEKKCELLNKLIETAEKTGSISVEDMARAHAIVLRILSGEAEEYEVEDEDEKREYHEIFHLVKTLAKKSTAGGKKIKR
jgi:hypothetical protein